jgi:hypothetical protein
MRRFHLGLLTAALPFLMLSLVLTGCKGSKDDEDDDDRGRRPGKTTKITTTGPKAASLKPVTATEYGVIRGKVTITEPPANLEENTKKLQAGISTSGDKNYCLKGADYETSQQAYRIGANKGLGNVFVWIVPEAGHYFEVPADQLAKFKDTEVIVSQPHCAFMPHAAVLFPSYYKDGKQVPTGQKLVAENDAAVNHNVKVSGGPLNPEKGRMLPKGDTESFVLKPEKGPVTVSCNVHSWMKAYLRIFDHPYAAVTSVGADLKKKQYEDAKSPKFGTYEIQGVPVGAKVRIVAWHEDLQFLEGDTGRELVIKKENVVDFPK